ncbi:response regulator transcription factor [Herbaspirillum sp. RTI4]|uniref:response regulator transcription factor n=1 Tax=Herbaspirillum sp. RTI4 TaxID=3048640 RepID=UPI002AB379F6|nr:response regulator transcription factor [Herbaspirillum sp. RTI4]MDY7578066.1 response regulator transcription factor [Herbaspirillum sp. RTI4]MEA9983417.1 response regulator transcription factor [Herbaspirillum sp. RTI4]
MQTDETEKIRILMADDHPIVMQGFSASLEKHHISIAAQVKTAESVLPEYEKCNPQVVILDIRFGGKLTGLDVARELLSQYPDARIIFLSQFDQNSLVKECYKIGAKAFITKDCDAVDLANAIKAAAKGASYFLPEIAERLATIAIKGDKAPQTLLDAREIDIFTLMAEGLTNAEMADRLSLSPRTISHISQTIKEKLDIYRSADITKLAVRYGLVEP